MTVPDPRASAAEIRRRQRRRAAVLAIVLGAMVVLFYAISIAKMAHS